MPEIKLRPGDKVRKKTGNRFSNGDIEATVDFVQGDVVHLVETGSWLYVYGLELVYNRKNPPHVHRDLIIAWANGAEIQVYLGGEYSCYGSMWREDRQYRIRPGKPNRDIEIEEIQKQIDELKQRLEGLKGE